MLCILIWGDVYNIYKCVISFLAPLPQEWHASAALFQAWLLYFACPEKNFHSLQWTLLLKDRSQELFPCQMSELEMLTGCIWQQACIWKIAQLHFLMFWIHPVIVLWFKYLLESYYFWNIFLTPSLMEKIWFSSLGFPACFCNCFGGGIFSILVF